ncbi:MAG: HAD-IIIA family hydrolase [Endomicrobium sp.]|nr:HAD-IIIA family hydrolase [Endomicrobium sp.]
MGTRSVKKSAVFLDRDGTLIFDRNYLNSPQQVKLYSFAAESINKLRTAGFKIIIVTNQSGIGRGMITEEELEKVNKKFISLLKIAGAKIDGLYYCPHIDSDNCCCRKPKTGMVMQGSKDFSIDLKKSYTIGDSARDYLLGFNMGGKGILVLTGHGKKQQIKVSKEKIKPFAVCKTLKQAVDLIIKNTKKINILLSILAISSVLCFAQNSYSSGDFKTAQDSFVSQKLASERKKLDENKKRYVWQKRGKYQIPEYEKLKYTILWNFIPVGEASLELNGFRNERGRKARYARLDLVTKSFLNSFYDISGTFESLFDEESKSSFQFISKTLQNGIQKSEHLFFEPVEQTYQLHVDGTIQKGKTAQYAQDILAALCYVRTLHLKVGSKYNLNIHSGNSSYPLTVKVLKKELIKIEQKSFNCFVVEPFVSDDANIMDLGGKMTIWITDDKQRMPVCVSVESQLGPISATIN